MDVVLQKLCNSLDLLSSVVLKAWTDDRNLNEVHGWNHPAITRHDLASIPLAISSRIREANVEELEPELSERLSKIPQRLQLLHATTVPYMFNGNGLQAIPAYMDTLNWVSVLIEPLLGWQSLSR